MKYSNWLSRQANLIGNYFVAYYRERSFGSGRVLLLSVLVGILAAFGAILFQIAVDFCKYIFLGQIVGLSLGGPAGEITLFHSDPQPYRWPLLLVVPTLGGLASGILVFFFAPEAKGHGTDGVIDSYHFKRGIIRPIVPVIKTIASAITIGTGGSAGKEGPIAQISAGMASFVGQRFKLSSRHMRIMIIAGLAAGIGATFRAPLAAGLFAAEVLYREMDFDRDVIMPALISPIIAYAVFTAFFEAGHLFATPNLAFNNSWELIPYTLVALIVGFGARGFVYVFDKSESFFDKLTIPNWTKPALGGFLVGVIGLAAPRALSESYGLLQDAHLNQLSIGVIIFLIFAKIATTSLTIGSGGSGGVFGPSIVIGGLIGGLVGMLVNMITPVSQSAYVIVGMAGFFSAAANTPISTIFMVSEMTGSYSLLVPTMWVSTLAYILGRGATLYKKQLWNHYEAPDELGEVRAAILEKMTVAGACRFYENLNLVSEQTPLSELDERAISKQRMFGVLSKTGSLVGQIGRQSIRYAKNQSQTNWMAVDLMEHSETVTHSESLWMAMQKMLRNKKTRLFVVDAENKPISFLKKQDILAAYDRRMSGLTQPPPDKAEKEVIEDLQPEPLTLKGVFYDVECTNREEILDYLSQLVAKGDAKLAREFRESLQEREDLGTTAMGHQFAFPHPHKREKVTENQGVYIVQTSKPIDYQAPDRLGVDKFVLFWFSSAKQHIDALAQIARAVSNKSLEEQLRQKVSASELSRIFVQSNQKS